MVFTESLTSDPISSISFSPNAFLRVIFSSPSIVQNY